VPRSFKKLAVPVLFAFLMVQKAVLPAADVISLPAGRAGHATQHESATAAGCAGMIVAATDKLMIALVPTW
jgi:hypothetical protein